MVELISRRRNDIHYPSYLLIFVACNARATRGYARLGNSGLLLTYTLRYLALFLSFDFRMGGIRGCAQFMCSVMCGPVMCGPHMCLVTYSVSGQ